MLGAIRGHRTGCQISDSKIFHMNYNSRQLVHGSRGCETLLPNSTGHSRNKKIWDVLSSYDKKAGSLTFLNLASVYMKAKARLIQSLSSANDGTRSQKRVNLISRLTVIRSFT